MKCQQCKNSTLESKELEPGLLVGHCTRCEGDFLSLFYYRHWASSQEADESSPGDDSACQTIEPEDTATALTCPKCSRLMMKYRLGLEQSNKVDFCAHCDEVWLDKGEWQLLKDLGLHMRLPSVVSEHWQTELNKQYQAQMTRSRYEKILGVDDFAKVSAFKQWLNTHPEQAQIRLYLLSDQTMPE